MILWWTTNSVAPNNIRSKIDLLFDFYFLLAPNPCDPNPCPVNHVCTASTLPGFSHICTGPCDDNPCLVNEQCTPTSATDFTCTGPCDANPCDSEETCVSTSPTEHRCDPGKKTHIKDVKPNEDKSENDVSCKWKHGYDILKVHSQTKQKWRWRFLTWR